CIPLNAETSANCGKSGNACVSCQSPNTCAMGACAPPTGGVGDGCTKDSDCAAVMSDTMGGPAVCHKTQVQVLPGATGPSNGSPYPGGYCTRQCYDDAQCGAGNLCAYYGGDWGEALNICYKGCDQDSDCRTGYTCIGGIQNVSPQGICSP